MIKKVRGTILVNFVKAIRADKSVVYDKYLQKDDYEIISQKILPSLWYPYETFQRCLNGVYEVIAKKEQKAVEDWGKYFAELILTEMYNYTIAKDNPLNHLRNVPIYIKTFFNFGITEVIVGNVNRVQLNMINYDPEFAPLYYLFCGWFQKVAELCGANNPKCQYLEKSWETKSPATSYLITWF